MRVIMKVPIAGLFHGHIDVQRGDVLDIEDESAVRYCNLDYCEPYSAPVEVAVKREEQRVERAVPQDVTVETATASAPALPKPLDEPDPVPVAAAVESSDSPKPGAGQRKSSAPNARRNR